ncbi:MAG: hypothetical protein NWE95_05100 [Candidatus Bathyarchaeota archaeon]|nr:hypothetical protein [Candidatus Bathyarchaeota archaeon]
MKKGTYTLVLSILVAFLAGTQTIQAQHTAGDQAFILASPLTITSPANTTYSSGLVTLNITVKTMLNPSTSNITMTYSINGKTNTTINTQTTFVPIWAEITYANGTKTQGISIQSYYLISAIANLPELSEGSHNITVYAKYDFSADSRQIGFDEKTVYFTVNDGKPPTISNLSLESKTYSQNALPLNFTIDQPTSWIGYSLDGKENVTITGNTTLTGIANGQHSLTVYANDTAGNMGVSQTVNFTVALPLDLSYAVAGTTIIAVAVSVILLLRIKVRKE